MEVVSSPVYSTHANNQTHCPEEKKEEDSRPITRNCIVLFSTQSLRSLHFDRCEALIDHLNNPSLQFVHITTDNRGIQNERKNVHYYTFPERSKLKSMDPKLWNNKCQTFLNSILDIFSLGHLSSMEIIHFEDC